MGNKSDRILNELKNDIKQRDNELRERSKELECLYGIAKISEEIRTIEGILTNIVHIIPQSWQYPDSACARIAVNGREFRTDNFQMTKYGMTSEIRVTDTSCGNIEIYYTREMPQADEGPFLLAERKLLDAVAERIGKILQRIEAEEKLKESNRKLQELFEHLQIIREKERKQIAYELHDELGHALTSLKLDLRLIQKNLDPDKAGIMEKTEAMKRDVDRIIHGVRNIVKELRPALLDDFGLIEALRFHAEEIKNRTGLHCLIDSAVDRLDITKKYSVGIFRIIQELLNNIIKHAGAGKVDITIRNPDNYLNIEIKDNGIGIREEDLHKDKSFGILGIRERMDIWGGHFKITGRTGKGTVVRMSFPLTEGSNND